MRVIDHGDSHIVGGADPSLVEPVSDPRVVSPIVTDPPLPHWRRALADYVESARYD